MATYPRPKTPPIEALKSGEYIAYAGDRPSVVATNVPNLRFESSPDVTAFPDVQPNAAPMPRPPLATPEQLAYYPRPTQALTTEPVAETFAGVKAAGVAPRPTGLGNEAINPLGERLTPEETIRRQFAMRSIGSDPVMRAKIEKEREQARQIKAQEQSAQQAEAAKEEARLNKKWVKQVDPNTGNVTWIPPAEAALQGKKEIVGLQQEGKKTLMERKNVLTKELKEWELKEKDAIKLGQMQIAHELAGQRDKAKFDLNEIAAEEKGQMPFLKGSKTLNPAWWAIHGPEAAKEARYRDQAMLTAALAYSKANFVDLDEAMSTVSAQMPKSQPAVPSATGTTPEGQYPNIDTGIHTVAQDLNNDGKLSPQETLYNNLAAKLDMETTTPFQKEQLKAEMARIRKALLGK